MKRIRPDPKAADTPKAPADSGPPKTESTQLDRNVSPFIPSNNRAEQLTAGKVDHVDSPHRHPSKDSQIPPQQTGPPPRDQPDTSRPFRPADQSQNRLDNGAVMPPPAVPSQTASAQELRETARQTIGRTERPEPRNQNGSAAPSPRIRSPSPLSRPGTRNPSNESRASGGKSRSDPGNPESSSDDRRGEREGRPQSREPVGNIGRRDSLTHNRTERSNRDRSVRDDKDRESEREKDRGRDRHTDRERDRDRDRERDRDRDRERDRDRDRDRDRHRRDDKDRDRNGRKERDAAPTRNQAPSPVAPPEDRATPSRTDIQRHRPALPNVDDNPGKRRRPTEDDVSPIPAHPAHRLIEASQPERGSSKRSSRKEGHREDRSRRPMEKEERPRESDRRRKDPDGDNEARASSSEKVISYIPILKSLFMKCDLRLVTSSCLNLRKYLRAPLRHQGRWTGI